MSVAARGQDVRMFDKKQMVDALTCLTFRRDLMLDRERFGVAHAPEIPNRQITH